MNTNPEDKTIIACSNINDDLPYFTEKFPGKVCCLCNLGEKSALGQGVIVQLTVKSDFKHPDRENNEERKFNYGTRQQPTSVSTGECNYELDKIGHSEIVHPSAFHEDGFVYVHRMCLMWSLRKTQITETDVNQFLTLMGEVLEQKCVFCSQYGASINCKMNCRTVHHYPCAAAAGCLLILESFTVFCTEHLSQVPLICSDNNVECLSCSSLGDLSKLIMCSSCGDHFHSTCIGLANLPDTRSGWCCARCTKCQICRQQDSNDIKFVKCEQCQKIYHASCLRPVISSIPKYGWKCNRCRVCTDCGSRTPGGGSSSRWHSHYTICDSCYQQRNKGFSCPICQKAYRAASHKEMVKCSWCHKFVHSTCDEEADLMAYHKKKEQNPDYDYVCPNCKTNSTRPPQSQLTETIDMALSESQTSDTQLMVKDIEMDPLEGRPTTNDVISEENHKQPPGAKKKVCFSNLRGKGTKFMLQRMGVMSQISKKRSTRGKGRQMVLASNSSDRYVNRNVDPDFGSDKKMLLCSARDKFILAQDICVMCGSLGIESDAVMITCAQCGQCYHPYCASVKPSKGILQKGWRCLDCTVCEGCGKKNDEARLLLCDECDISYHIYCVNPPLETVPQGTWKCSFCTMCQKCGRNPTEKSDNVDSNMSECPPCASQTACSVCTNPYANGEMIIQCEKCEQWSHFLCDSVNAQLTIDYYDKNIYKCLKCRSNAKPQLSAATSDTNIAGNEDIKPATGHKLQTQMSSTGSVIDGGKAGASGLDRNVMLSSEINESPEAIHWIDGVCLSENGLNMIKSLSTEIKRKRKMRQPMGKDGQLDTTTPDEVPNDKYKDGMIWDGTEATLPEGFSISTNDEGVHILRKKRQRNLQKLGIGGFSVRNRAVKKDNEETTVDPINSGVGMDKKKKIIRKKQKNKLIEAYPAYLQEAFFGKPLLESGETVQYESESSDEIDTSMKMYFTRPDTKTPETETLPAIKSPAKTLKKVKQEKTIPDTKPPAFAEQYSVVSHSMVTQASTPTNLFDSTNPGEIPPTPAPIRHTMEAMAPQNMSEVDGTNTSVKFLPSSDNMEKPLGDAPVVKIENYSVTQQVGPPEQKFHGHLYMPANITTNSPQHQLHYQQQQQPPDTLIQQNRQNIPTMIGQGQVYMQGEIKRVEEVSKPNDIAPEGLNAGTQKTAEKMRKDEDLGLMATISAVLYANTEHANLKELFPNWNDRCKQILKRWRSLCNEKKAPFLQKAKDNRSALRQRREQSKITVPQKAPPKQEQDLSRTWKQQHPSGKLKQEQSNMFVSYNPIQYDNTMCYVGPVATTPTTPQATHVSPLINDNMMVKAASSTSIKVVSTSDNRLELNSVYGTEPIGDKKLRNLLQKTNSEPMLMGNNSELFMQNDVLRLGGLMANPALIQNNPMLSTSGKSQLLEGRTLEQDVKNHPDLKMSESQEGISSSAVELENVGFGDILGGLGEGDDDDLLKSLTSEIGDDFNILEYADTELDVNVLNTLDFEDNEKCSN
ncbi:uncharacterized protein Dwil_GK15714 [Drosophila willistoni]|uniref:Histone-lysine N-methyltransferase 2C n=1 Tax=Drosophila willistoni TaxID=7260 RepID=B4MRN9_DROWI|nr:uncharacterized protein Dwil_GK15714 [Drosophila willistoni]